MVVLLLLHGVLLLLLEVDVARSCSRLGSAAGPYTLLLLLLQCLAHNNLSKHQLASPVNMTASETADNVCRAAYHWTAGP